jgi:hypothetical protein
VRVVSLAFSVELGELGADGLGDGLGRVLDVDGSVVLDGLGLVHGLQAEATNLLFLLLAAAILELGATRCPY